MTRLVIDPNRPDRAVLERAAAIIRAGGIVALPTDTLYGLAADPFNDRAASGVFAAKGRPAGQPLPLIASGLDQVINQLGPLPPLGSTLARRFWPGPLTLVVAAPARMSAIVTGGTGSAGVRVPAHAVARGLCEACGHLLTATSANLSGQPAALDARDVGDDLQIQLLLDAGPAPGGPPSTVVDVTGPAPKLVRAGAVSWEDVRECLGLV